VRRHSQRADVAGRDRLPPADPELPPDGLDARRRCVEFSRFVRHLREERGTKGGGVVESDSEADEGDRVEVAGFAIEVHRPGSCTSPAAGM
jgi:hypothetical protein